MELDAAVDPKDQPGSIAYKLAQMAGEKSAEAPTAEEQEAARLAEEEAAKAAEAAQDDAEAARKAEEEAEAAAAAAAADLAAKEAELEPPKPKFESIEDYDKAYKEAETKMHTATEEAAKERKAREAVAAEREQLQKELEELRTAQQKANEELAAARETERMAADNADKKVKVAEAIRKIQAIKLVEDPATGQMVYPKDYEEQVAEAWAPVIGGADPDEIAERAMEKLRAKQEAETAERRRTDAEAEAARIQELANRQATELGLDMNPGSADYRLFGTFVDELRSNPEHEYRNKPFEEQVKWVVDSVNKSLGKKIEMSEAEKKAALEAQRRNAILGRGVNRPAAPTEEPKRQRTMQEILDAQR